MPLTWPDPQPDPTKANTKDADTRSVLLQEYSDHGQWARHYSTVRMTLGTFFITAATGVITLRWEKPQLAIAVFAGAVFFLGFSLFIRFTYLTFHEMRAQFEIVDSYRQKLGAAALPKRSGMMSVTGLPLALLFLIAFAAFDFWWLEYSKPLPAPPDQISTPAIVGDSATPGVAK